MASGGSRKSLNSSAVEKRLSRAGGGRLACKAAIRLMRRQRLGDARARLAAGQRRRHAHQGDALAGAHQQLGEGQRQHHGAIALGGLRQMAAEGHRRRDVRPQPEGMRRLPFALAHVEMVGAGRAPPVDDGGGVAGLELAELPEGLAACRAGAGRGCRARPRWRRAGLRAADRADGRRGPALRPRARRRSSCRPCPMSCPVPGPSCRGASRHPLITPALQPSD